MPIAQISTFYQNLVDQIPHQKIELISYSDKWCFVKTKSSAGFAMMCPSHLPVDLEFLNKKSTLQELAQEISSFHFSHASFAMAAINCFFNQSQKLKESKVQVPSCIDLLDHILKHYSRKKIVSIGSFAFLKQANLEKLQIIEKNPKNNEYPDTAAEYLIQDADLILLTGATLINKSFERLLSLAQNKEVFLIGPSIPFYQELFPKNISLFGYSIVDAQSCLEQIEAGLGKKLLSSSSVHRLDKIQTL
ncbi:DUF364 domain-containing protein [bacterium]|nr:DUF364 domain-containing protein [bacterium]